MEHQKLWIRWRRIIASFSLSSSLYCSLSRMSPSNMLGHHGRHLALPSHALPSPTDVLRRSATPSSTSPLKESSRRALNRRRSCRFSPETEVCRHQICRRRPSSGQANPTGESPVSSRSGRTPPRALPLAASPAMPGRRRHLGAGRAGSLPSRPGQCGLACGPRAPSVSGPG
jgi:hypothetical protein